MFKKLGVDEIRLRNLIMEYNKYSRLLKTMKQLDKGSKAFSEAGRIIQGEKDRLASKIVEMAETAIPDYKSICEALELPLESLYGRVALADMLLNIDSSRGLRRF
ncbi:MAG: hypothetical protein QW815_05965 [Nitrososphaerota archaeon]